MFLRKDNFLRYKPIEIFVLLHNESFITFILNYLRIQWMNGRESEFVIKLHSLNLDIK